MMELKVPPNNPEMEKATLGSMMVDKDAIEVAKEMLKDSHFYAENNSTVFKTILYLHNKNSAVDIMTLTAELKKQKLLDKIGGTPYLMELIDSVATSANIKEYAAVVREKALLRAIIKNAQQILIKSYEENLDKNDALIKTSNEKISQLITLKDYAKIRAINITDQEYPQKYLDVLDERQKKFSKGPELPTGLRDLDRMTWGLNKGYVWVIAGRTSLGKTALCVNISLSIIKKGLKVLFFTTESTPEDIFDRLISVEFEINGFNLRTGKLSKVEWQTLTDKIPTIMGKNLFVSDIPCPTVEDIQKTVKEIKPDLFILDYIDRMTLPSAETEAKAFVYAMNSMQTLALEHNCACIVASQLNREVEKRTKEIPKLSDLKGSAGKEESAGTVLLLSKSDISKDDQAQEMLGRGSRKTDLWVAKQKAGPTGKVELEFVEAFTKFKDI